MIKGNRETTRTGEQNEIRNRKTTGTGEQYEIREQRNNWDKRTE